MEHNGAGTMGRTWMPDPRITPMVLSGRREAPAELGTLRIYLDGKPEPALEGPTYDLLNGTTITSYPFGHKSLSSAVSYLPIPWAKGCKITMDVEPQYYIFTYRDYAEGTKVKTFTMDDLKTVEKEMKRVGDLLVSPEDASGNSYHSMNTTIEPKSEVSVELPAGTHAVRTLSVKLGSYDDPQVTRSLVLRIVFDGQETVWCPVGDFFGTGVGLHPFKDWYRTVARDGTMTCRWVMPYQRSAEASLLNLHDQPVQVQLIVTVGEWEWDDRSMYFHASWQHESNIRTMPRSDWNYITLNGRGVYVGDTLTVWNPREIWWGEGDAKIWVDGESFPSIFGTGTEDYYAYSYGGQNRRFYDHPFHAQVRVMDFDQNYR
ncbi:MAG: glycoside hydrolase family 172 protein, partial [Planctomycetota bacterium]